MVVLNACCQGSLPKEDADGSESGVERGERQVPSIGEFEIVGVIDGHAKPFGEALCVRRDRRHYRQSRHVVSGRYTERQAQGRRNRAGQWRHPHRGAPALQISKHLGAEKAIATARNTAALESVAALGADVTMALAENEAALKGHFEEQFAAGWMLLSTTCVGRVPSA